MISTPKKGWVQRLLILLGLLVCLESTADSQVTQMPIKLSVGTYNVGHFNSGQLGGYHLEEPYSRAALNRWRQWIGQQSLDILGVNEWNLHFDRAKTINAQKELLDPYYDYVSLGTENTWIFNGFATNFKIDNVRQESMGGAYYALIGEFRACGKTITIVSVHLPWQDDLHENSIQKLIKLLKSFESFICMGDMNAADTNQLRFADAGFNIANGGKMGWFVTNAKYFVPSIDMDLKKKHHIDNIITSGDIKIMNVRAPETGLNDLDHLPIMADIVITPSRE